MPVGGVTVYNQRKLSLLQSEYNVIHLDTSVKNVIKFLLIIIFSNKDVLISSMNPIFIFINFFALTKHVSFIDHNASRHFNNKKILSRLIYKISLRKAAKIIIVDEYLKGNYISFGNDLNFKIESAFIPPDLNKIEIISKKYPFQIQNLKERKCIIASISKPYLNSNGEDVYNSNLILDCFEKLSLKYKNLYFVIGLSDVSRDSDYANKIIDKADYISSNYENIFVIKNGTDLWPIFNNGLIYFRPTLTDGDSITLREAIFFGCQSIVSDVVPRPHGVSLFNLKEDNVLNKLDDMLEKIYVGN